MKWVYQAGTKTTRDTPGNHWIASMSWDKGVDHEANAHLIAAAPDMYRTLQWAADEIWHLQTEMGENPEVVGCYSAIKQALERAEGR